jgi:hypothetical protein
MDMLHEEIGEEVLCRLGSVLYLNLLETTTLRSLIAQACRDTAACHPKEAADILGELVGITHAVAAHARHTRQLLSALTHTQAVLRRGDEHRLYPLPESDSPNEDGCPGA